MFKSRYSKSFKKECNTKLSCPAVRRAMLLKHRGTNSVYKMVNADGTVRSIDEMCSTEEKAMYRRTWMVDNLEGITDLEEEAQMAMEGEQEELDMFFSNLTSAQTAALEQICASEATNSVVAFRKALLESKDFKVCAIHFFHWDGTVRDVKSIRQALHIYPCSYRKQDLIKAAAGGAMLLGVGAYGMRKLRKNKEK